MIFREGDMFTALKSSNLFLVTGNSFVTGAGRLVMGRGAAKQAKERFQDIDLLLGIGIPHLDFYGIRTIKMMNHEIGVFQVKYHWKDQADIKLIVKSCQMLRMMKPVNCHLNFPGIGNGRLNRSDVLPILENYLSDQDVTIWEYESVTSQKAG